MDETNEIKKNRDYWYIEIGKASRRFQDALGTDKEKNAEKWLDHCLKQFDLWDRKFVVLMETKHS